jgi:hypothetical protein
MMLKARRIFQVAGRGSVAIGYDNVRGNFYQEPNCAGRMWPLGLGMEE